MPREPVRDAAFRLVVLWAAVLALASCAPPERFGGGPPIPRVAAESVRTSPREPLRADEGFTWDTGGGYGKGRGGRR